LNAKRSYQKSLFSEFDAPLQNSSKCQTRLRSRHAPFKYIRKEWSQGKWSILAVRIWDYKFISWRRKLTIVRAVIFRDTTVERVASEIAKLERVPAHSIIILCQGYAMQRTEVLVEYKDYFQCPYSRDPSSPYKPNSLAWKRVEYQGDYPIWQKPTYPTRTIDSIYQPMLYIPKNQRKAVRMAENDAAIMRAVAVVRRENQKVKSCVVM
jgi:hypothetical protein